jgi:hypothetical protein
MGKKERERQRGLERGWVVLGTEWALAIDHMRVAMESQ